MNFARPTDRYTEGGRRGRTAPNIEDTSPPPLLQACLEEATSVPSRSSGKARCPNGAASLALTLKTCMPFVYGHLSEDDDTAGRGSSVQAEIRPHCRLCPGQTPR